MKKVTLHFSYEHFYTYVILPNSDQGKVNKIANVKTLCIHRFAFYIKYPD